MARLAKYAQSVNDRKRYTIDYENWLDTGETVTSVAFEIDPATTPALTVGSSDISDDGLSVSFFVEDGDDGETYQVLVTVTTSGGQVSEDWLLFDISDPADAA